MRDDNNDGIPDEPESEALKGHSRAMFKTKDFLKETMGGAAQGALIGAIALPTVAFVASAAVFGPFAFMAAGIMGVVGSMTGVAAPILAAGAMQGAAIGAAIGGGIKGISALTNGDERADDEEQRLIAKFQRSQQMAANNEMMKVNMARIKSGAPQQPSLAGMQAAPGQLPNMRGVGAGIGPGSA